MTDEPKMRSPEARAMIDEILQDLPEDTRLRLSYHDAGIIKTAMLRKLISQGLVDRRHARPGSTQNDDANEEADF